MSQELTTLTHKLTGRGSGRPMFCNLKLLFFLKKDSGGFKEIIDGYNGFSSPVVNGFLAARVKR